MKLRLLLLVLSMALSVHFVNAQVSVGANLGLTISNVQVRGIAEGLVPNRNYITTFRPQMELVFPLDDRLSVYTGLGLEKRGFDLFIGREINFLGFSFPLGVTVLTRVNYIELPLQLNFAIPTKSGKVIPWVRAGANFGFALSGEIKTQANLILNFTLNKREIDMTNKSINRFDIAPVIVVGLDLPYGNGVFTAFVGFEHSVENFINDATIGVETRHFGFNPGLGYRFNIGKKIPKENEKKV